MNEFIQLLTPHFGFGIFTAAIVLIAGHYFPLPKRDLHPLLKYSCGTAIMLLGVGVWLGLGLKMWGLYAGLWLLAFVSGVAVALCYGYDAIMNQGMQSYAMRKVVRPPKTRGGPRTPADAFRIKVENIIACLLDADEHLRVALLRITQWAKTEEEKIIVDEVLDTRTCVDIAHTLLLEFHPDRREKEASTD